MPGSKALAVEMIILVHYRGQGRGMARKGRSNDPISRKKRFYEFRIQWRGRYYNEIKSP
jgi:hypothetical protein